MYKRSFGFKLADLSRIAPSFLVQSPRWISVYASSTTSLASLKPDTPQKSLTSPSPPEPLLLVQRNEVGIQTLPLAIQNKVFPSSLQSPRGRGDALRSITTPSTSPAHAELAKEHLTAFGLWNKTLPPLPPIDMKSCIDLVEGCQDIEQHFQIIGSEQCHPYLGMAEFFSKQVLPDKPDVWIQKSGWTKYLPDGSHQSVPYPECDKLVFDVEVLYNLSKYPVMATAVSERFWYSWVSPEVMKAKGRESDPPASHLINFGNPEKTKILIGHNIAFDRSRILQEYCIKPTKFAFIDTMSLHSAVGGLSAQQRPQWKSRQKQKSESDNQIHAVDMPYSDQINNSFSEENDSWIEQGSMNSLRFCAELYLGLKIDKSCQQDFGSMTMAEIKDDAKFQELMSYCANDVAVTFDIFTIVLPQFFDKCPHPVSFAGMLHMGKGFLTVSEDWQNYIKLSEAKYEEYFKQIELYLVDIINDLVKLKDDPPLSDPWLSKLDWTIPEAPMTKEVLAKDGSIKKPARFKKYVCLELIGMPQWYRELWDRKAKKLKISISMRITPYLLRLQWNSHPLIYLKSKGWCYRISKDEIPSAPGPPPINLSTTEGDANYDEFASFDTDHNYFQVPHPEGEGKNCGNPLTKSFLSAFEKNDLNSEFPATKDILRLGAQCTYWSSTRKRVLDQFVVWNDEGFLNAGDEELIPHEGGGRVGAIIPQINVMGTVTRRAVEATWMTASNAKINRIGSELKAMIQAPGGYKFVGADVDSQELWIASLLGDSRFGIHGASAIGFMTLQGTKSAGTDLHTTAGKIVGISRDEAKVFNYSRIYGAGVKHSVQLLMKSNPSLRREEAQKKVMELFKSTKGDAYQNRDREGGFPKKLWFGGSESFMFNKLEEISNLDSPRTPFLNCEIPNTLLPEHVSDQFSTSRVNWVVQSSGVDYLHLLLASMDYLIRRMGINARFLLSIHDELRFLVKDEDFLLAVLALQISNLWVRSFFASRVGIRNLPFNVAFFSAVDVDHCLRKEVDMACLTPSNLNAIKAGKALNVYETIQELEKGDPDALNKVLKHSIPSLAMAVRQSQRMKKDSSRPCARQELSMLKIQMAQSKNEVDQFVKGIQLSRQSSHVPSPLKKFAPSAK